MSPRPFFPTPRRLRLPLQLLVTLAAIALACGGAAVPPDPWSGWCELQMKVRGAGPFSGRLELVRDRASNPQRLETAARARFLFAVVARSRTTSAFDDSGRVREHVSRSAKRLRRYRFGADDYSVEKFRTPRGIDSAEATWERQYVKRFPYPDAGARVHDYYGMLLQLAEEPLDRPGDAVRLLVATADGVEAFTVRVEERRRVERTYERLPDGTQHIVPADELRLRVTPDDPDRADAGFLDMEGETELWVEARSKVPLEISGKVPHVPGRVVIELIGLRSGP